MGAACLIAAIPLSTNLRQCVGDVPLLQTTGKLTGNGCGAALWSGQFEEDVTRLWLRWSDRDGNVISTGAERADQAEERAGEAEQKAQRLAERLRAMGVNPDEI